jgi:hypothetical protein
MWAILHSRIAPLFKLGYSLEIEALEDLRCPARNTLFAYHYQATVPRDQAPDTKIMYRYGLAFGT